MTYTIIDHGNENTRTESARNDAEDKAKDLKMMVDDPNDIEVTQGDYEDYQEYQNDSDDESEDEPVPVPNESPGDVIDAEPTETAVSNVQNKDISQDPLTVMPSHFVDEIQGVPTINRKGYAVLAEHYGISVTAEPVTLPSETDFEYAEFRAIATTEDGTEYSGFGSAHVDRQDGDDKHLLAELAETRAMKRALSYATGVGMTAATEMKNTIR
jgi:hypothetical protein